MNNVQKSLQELQSSLPGFLGAALVDHASGMALGTHGTGLDLEVAAAGNTEVVRAKLRVMEQLEIDGAIEDILITLDEQLHLIRPIGDSLFMYVALDKKQGNLGMARHVMSRVAQSVRI